MYKRQVYKNGMLNNVEYTYNERNQVSKMRKYWSNTSGSGYNDEDYTYDGNNGKDRIPV